MTTPRTAPFYPWVAIPEADWNAMVEVGAAQQRRTERARHGLVYRKDSNFVGLCGEWCYASLCALDWSPGGFYDGGTDFPHVDVKTAPVERRASHVFANRESTALNKASLYFQAVVDLEQRLVQPCGYATREMLNNGREYNMPFGVRRGVHFSDLLTADELLAQLLAGRDINRLGGYQPDRPMV